MQYSPTVEDKFTKHLEVNGKAVFAEILDTAGQDEFSSMQDQWMRDGKGFLLVYNITDRTTFENITVLHEKILRTKDTTSVPIVIVGNKCDLRDDRDVSHEEGKQLAEKWGCPFYETSAKEKINNEVCFFDLVREIRKKQPGPSKEENDKKPAKKKFCSIL